MFDDTAMNLYLDVCIDGKWRRILPNKAKEAMKAAPLSNGESDRSLSANDVANLMQGEPVGGLTAVVVPQEEDQ